MKVSRYLFAFIGQVEVLDTKVSPVQEQLEEMAPSVFKLKSGSTRSDHII